MKSTCWNCKYFVYLGRGHCTKTYTFEDTEGDDSCNDFVIAEELKKGGKFVLKENGFREWEE